jgi:methylated-DNA-[protein]-cysteine S-methyltransferase
MQSNLCQTEKMLEWTQIEIAPDLILRLVASPSGLRAIDFDLSRPCPGERRDTNSTLLAACHQLRDYFDGNLRQFDVDLDMQGTDFQKRVWRRLETIPYGAVRSYAQIATEVGSPKAVRAVGAANGANPIPIVIPCHRVIGSSGKLVGYGGGLPLKKRLLEIEGCNMILFRA